MRRLAILPLLLSTATFSAFASIDPGLLALVPPEAKVVSAIDLDRARNSEFGQYMTAKMHTTSHDFEQFVSETGFDPRHDIQQLLFADAGRNAEGEHTSLTVLARGNFDSGRIQSAATGHGFVPQSFQGATLFVKKSENSPSAFAFLGNGLAVMGDVAMVKRIVSNRDTPTALDPVMQAQISRIGTDNDAWFVSLIAGEHFARHFNRAQSNESGSNPPGASSGALLSQSQALQSVVQASGGIRFGSIVDVSFDAVTRSPQDATSLADVVRFFASMVQMGRQKDPSIGIAASAFDNMQLATDGNSVHLSISLPEKMLEQLVDSPPRGVSMDFGATVTPPHAQ